MPKFRKKAIVIEAIQFKGYNAKEIIDFCQGRAFIQEGIGGSADGEGYPQHYQSLKINTLEGDMLVSFNDWVIKGIKGEFYPCKPEIFGGSYEEVD